MTKTIIFLHIPKAAGTTLHRIIERQYPQEHVLSFGADAVGSLAAFKAMSNEERSEIQVLKGHLPFGVHKYFPQPTTYITFLRNPVERIISYYQFVLLNPEHYLHEQVTSQDMSLLEVLENKMTPDIANGQVRLLSGVWNNVPVGECTQQMLDKAKEHMHANFSVIGLVEQFDASLILLKRAFNWQHIHYQKQNVSANRSSQITVSPQTLKAIQHYNNLDTQLYAYAQELFQAQLDQQEKTFSAKLRLFLIQNWIYNNIYRNKLNFIFRRA